MIQLTELPPHLEKAILHGTNGLDIMHGELKVLIEEAEAELELAQADEALSEEAIDSMERRYWEGQVDALTYLYQLTYTISFALAEREKNGQD